MITKDTSIEAYTKELASRAPTPGGGGASAIAGAMGASLASMVCNLTIGKKKYADVEDDIKAIMERMEERRKNFLKLSDSDAEAFAPLSKAYGLPSDTDEAKKHKEEVLEPCLKTAAGVPMDILTKACETIDDLKFLSSHGSKLAVSDVGVSATYMKTAVEGAILNIKINTKLMKDRNYAENLNKQAEKAFDTATKALDGIYHEIKDRLGE